MVCWRRRVASTVGEAHVAMRRRPASRPSIVLECDPSSKGRWGTSWGCYACAVTRAAARPASMCASGHARARREVSAK